MTQDTAPAPSTSSESATVADVMMPAVTTAELKDHVAAAAYLMKHNDTTALVVLNARAGGVAGILTDTDVAHAVADGKDLDNVRIVDIMTENPTTIRPDTSTRDAARIMTTRHFRHLPVVDDSGLAGIVDLVGVCGALLGDPAPPADGGTQPDLAPSE